jgi:hypothetical protein
LDLARAQPVLAFFAARLRLPPIWTDAALVEEALCTREGVVLHPSAAEGPQLAAVLAHELFHFWSRGAVQPAKWGALPRRVPRFAVERNHLLKSLNGAGVEELAADLLTERLCARLGLHFAPAYLVALPADLLEVRLEEARALLASLPLSPAPPKGLAAQEAEQAALAPVGEALRRLSGFELAALALHELRVERAVSVTHFPALLRPVAQEVHAGLVGPLDALDAPGLLSALCAVFTRPHLFGHERGPLWEGASPLELPGRALAARLRSDEGREGLREWVAIVRARLELPRDKGL